jgi:hypothetical protein
MYGRPPLWSSRQSSWLLTQRSRVRFPTLRNFLRSSGSGTGSTKPREVKMRSYFKEKVAASVSKTEINDRGGIRSADHATPFYPQKLADKWR